MLRQLEVRVQGRHEVYTGMVGGLVAWIWPVGGRVTGGLDPGRDAGLCPFSGRLFCNDGMSAKLCRALQSETVREPALHIGSSGNLTSQGLFLDPCCRTVTGRNEKQKGIDGGGSTVGINRQMPCCSCLSDSQDLTPPPMPLPYVSLCGFVFLVSTSVISLSPPCNHQPFLLKCRCLIHVDVAHRIEIAEQQNRVSYYGRALRLAQTLYQPSPTGQTLYQPSPKIYILWRRVTNLCIFVLYNGYICNCLFYIVTSRL